MNRLWAYFLGYGFTTPMDDFGSHNLPTHPALLDGLAQRFADYSYDLKSLMRWIVLSKPYGLTSRMKAESTKDAQILVNSHTLVAFMSDKCSQSNSIIHCW